MAEKVYEDTRENYFDSFGQRGPLAGVGYGIRNIFEDLKALGEALILIGGAPGPEHAAAPKYDPFKEAGKVLDRRKREKERGLDKKITTAVSISGILFGLFLLSPNITGNAIRHIPTETSNSFGLILVGIGLFAFIWSIRNK